MNTWPKIALVGLLLAAGRVHAEDIVHYYYTDPQGTVLAKADAAGNVIASYDYAPYGSQALGTPPDGPGYTGHVNDPDTGLVYMQARYYDPSTGRFLSVDPVGPAPGNPYNFNRFAYANNNPIVNMDPDGRCTGSHIGNSDGTCASTGEYTTKTSSAHSLGIEQNKISQSRNVLSYNTFSSAERSPNGAVDNSIIWKLKNPSKHGGYIVQNMKLSVSSNLNVKDPNYFEAWHVSPGQAQTDRMATGSYNYDDAFSFSGGKGHGEITWSASARFYEGLALPVSFAPYNVSHAGPLPSTIQDPNLPTQGATSPVIRTLTTSW